VLEADGADACMAVARTHAVDLFMLDISMPGRDGWALARELRDGGRDQTPIMMVSADAFERSRPGPGAAVHDAFLVKPVDLDQFIDKVGNLLQLRWIQREEAPAPDTGPPPGTHATLSDDAAASLVALGEIGYVRGIENRLDELEAGPPGQRAAVARLRPLVREFRFRQFMQTVEDLRERTV